MFKMLKLFVLIYFMAIIVKSDNGRKKRGFEERQGRLFSFNVIDEDINVAFRFSIPIIKIPLKKKLNEATGLMISLDLSIPFIRIPVKKTMNSVYGLTEFPSININPASLALGGAALLGTTIFIPFLLKSYVKQQEDLRYSRLLDNAEFDADAMLEFAQQMFINNHAIRGCPLRLACWVAHKQITDPRAVLSLIVSNKLLSTMVNSSAVEDAMISGLHGRSCNSYGPCPLKEHHLPMILNNLALFTNNPFIITP